MVRSIHEARGEMREAQERIRRATNSLSDTIDGRGDEELAELAPDESSEDA
jgi:hypothetical protein